MAEKNQGIRAIKMLEMLRNETDEEHVLTREDIEKRLAAQGIKVERRTFYKDIELLKSAGFDIEHSLIGHAYGYYLVEQPFSVAELKLIVDALHAANFLTEKKTDELIEKVANVGSKYKAEDIKSNNIHFNTKKHTNESILINIEQLNKAIKDGKKITANALDLNYKGKVVYRHKKKLYTLEPLALIHNGDNYYVLCYDEEKDVYPRRIDRLANINVSEEEISDIAKSKVDVASKYTDSVFRMFGGEKTSIKIEFTEDVLNSIFDNFSEKQPIIETVNSGIYQTTVDVEDSPTFWGWVFQFTGSIKILSPKWVVDEYKAKLNAGNEINK